MCAAGANRLNISISLVFFFFLFQHINIYIEMKNETRYLLQSCENDLRQERFVYVALLYASLSMKSLSTILLHVLFIIINVFLSRKLSRD